jgi:hypothetical protein
MEDNWAGGERRSIPISEPKDKWKNRRAMAWISLIAGLCFPAVLLVSDSDQLGSVAGAFYLFVGSVVGAYIGFATVDDRWQKDKDA